LQWAASYIYLPGAIQKTASFSMSINQSNIIDVIGTTLDNKVVLTISDHHSWQESWHLQLLQDKINSYLQFIEGGQLLEHYPNARDKEVIIETIMKYEPTKDAISFLERAKEIIATAGIGFQWRVLTANK
jgi:hypothetical protein